MIERSSATRGIARTSCPLRFIRHVPFSVASSMLASKRLAVDTLSSRAGISSDALAGDASLKSGAWISDWLARVATAPGVLATCKANSPSVRDFLCGFHPS